MDLYSILGQQLSVDEALPPESAPAAAALRLRAQPSGAARSGLETENTVPTPEEYTLALRLLAEAKLRALLASAVERVRYITNASGVALALCEGLTLAENGSDEQRENSEDAMVCHAGSGPAAPEVGARMYIRSGITAESLRTRQTLRCDHASTDPRVNQESCKALGIESVLVMPVILNRNVVGMFQLFSARAVAFTERDATTLRACLPQVQFSLQEAVQAGLPLGHISWAEEEPATVEAHDEVACDGVANDPAILTVKLPVAFPIDSFRKADSAGQPQDQPHPAEPEVPAFLARLADEARPVANRTWSQWFRPQW